MNKFKSVMVALYEEGPQIYWKSDSDIALDLEKRLLKEKGRPLESFIIEIIGGNIVNTQSKSRIKPWMRDYIKIMKPALLDIEIQAKKWMQTHRMEVLNISGSQGFTIPKGANIHTVIANESRNLTFEGKTYIQNLLIRDSKDVIIPKGVKIQNIHAGRSRNLRFEGPIKADYLDIGKSDNFVIPRFSRIDLLSANESNNLTFEGPIIARQINLILAKNVIIPERSKIGSVIAHSSENLRIPENTEIETLIFSREYGLSIQLKNGKLSVFDSGISTLHS